MKARLTLLLVVALAAPRLCAAAASGATPVNAPAQPVMVLIHGAAGGGWQFKQVAALMEATHFPMLLQPEAAASLLLDLR